MELLRFLQIHTGQPVNREVLLQALWPGGTVSPRAVDSAVARLRRKLATRPDLPFSIHTVSGCGYSLSRDDAPWTPPEQHTAESDPPTLAPKMPQVGPCRVDLQGRGLVRPDGQRTPLTAQEHATLRVLLQQRGAVVPVATLVREAWGLRVVQRAAISNTIYRLRRKLGDAPLKPHLLVSVHRTGYCIPHPPSALRNES